MCRYIEELEILQRIFKALNKHYFGGLLEPVVITIQSDLKAYGHYTAKKVWIAGEGKTQTEYHEINLSAETLKRPYHATCATLMHEMIHHFCHCNGITDTSRQGRYHNKEFKRVAEEKGLIITYSPVIGWNVTEPSEKFKQYIDSLGIDFKKIYRDTEVKEPKAASQSTVYKYECPICGLKIRTSKQNAHIKCVDCNQELQSY